MPELTRDQKQQKARATLLELASLFTEANPNREYAYFIEEVATWGYTSQLITPGEYNLLRCFYDVAIARRSIVDVTVIENLVFQPNMPN